MQTEFPDISELVPHSGAMLWLDRLVEWAPGKATCVVTPKSGSPFVVDGSADAILSIEYMGQAVAACLGYEAFLGGEGVRVGMIIGSRKFEIHHPRFVVDSVVEVAVERIRGNESLSHFSCTTQQDGRVVASGQLTLIHAEKPPE